MFHKKYCLEGKQTFVANFVGNKVSLKVEPRSFEKFAYDIVLICCVKLERQTVAFTTVRTAQNIFRIV